MASQTRQRFGPTIDWPALQEKARSNSGMFTTGPLTRYLPGELGSVSALTRRFGGVKPDCFLHQKKKRSYSGRAHFRPEGPNLLNKAITPSFIVKYLDQYVIGQDDAKKTVAVTVYSHFKKIAKSQLDGMPIAKSNVLLIGPSGTGKTLLCETLSVVLGVPFVTAEATALAQSRYVNEEIEAVLQRLVDKAGGDVAKSQNGIVFIDEIDKLKAIDGQPRSVSGESVQHALLKIMEGAAVKLANGRYIDTTNILFICGGAFVGLDDI